MTVDLDTNILEWQRTIDQLEKIFKTLMLVMLNFIFSSEKYISKEPKDKIFDKSDTKEKVLLERHHHLTYQEKLLNINLLKTN